MSRRRPPDPGASPAETRPAADAPTARDTARPDAAPDAADAVRPEADAPTPPDAARPAADPPTARDAARPAADAPTARDTARPDADAPTARDAARPAADAPTARDAARPDAGTPTAPDGARSATADAARPDPAPEPGPPTLADTARRAVPDLVGWRLDRLRRALDGPLWIVGAGGSLPVARLWAALHARGGHPARAVPPLALREAPPPKGTAVLVLSASGRHHDILGAVDAALAAGHPVHAITTDAQAPLIDRLRTASPRHHTLALTAPAIREALAARHAPVPMALLAGHLYGAGDIAADLALFETPAADADAARALADPRPADVVALGAGLARPAAEAFAHLVRESGLAPARAADPREFAHGEFVAVGPQTRLAVFAAAEQRWSTRYLAALPVALAPLRVVEARRGVAGAVALYARALAAAGAAMEAAGARPGRDAIPPWAAALYRLPV